MKNEINPVVAAAVVILVVIAAVGVGYVAMNREERAPTPSKGPITLPSSQIGTKLGGRVLGGQIPAPEGVGK